MKRLKHLYILAGVAFAGVMASCATSDIEPEEPSAEESGNVVMHISADIAADMGPAAETGSPAGELNTMLMSDKFPEGSLIFISQLGQKVSPLFPLTYTPETPNFYAYQYNGNESANWDQGYNFTLAPNSSPIEWEKIRSYGSVGNTFNLYSLYFPAGEIGKNGTVSNVVNNYPDVYAVTEWQNSRTVTEMKNYDVMGAYHATSSAYTRLTFRFYHLMVYVRVTLYVPVYDPQTDTGFTESAFGYSRFTTSVNVRDLLPGIAVGCSNEHGNQRNMSRFWTIDYHANRSSDREGPLVRTVPSSQNSPYGDSRANFYMHPWGIGDSHDAYFEEMTLTNVRDFYPNAESNTDRVRKYEFTAIIPPQDITGELLFMHLKKPGVDASIMPENLTKDQIKNYYFSVNQLVSGKNDISFASGTMNHIELYIPRKSNDVVKVRANILPWTETTTDMPLVDEDDINPNPDEETPENIRKENR